DVLKSLKTPRQEVRCVQVGLNLGSKVQFKLTKQVYQHVFKKNGTSSSSPKKKVGLTKQEASSSNPFDALNTVENDDELGMNGKSQSWLRKGPIGTSSEAVGSPNTTPLAAKINDLERQMLDEKLVFVDDDGKPLKPSMKKEVNMSSICMLSGGANDADLLEDEDFDRYDGFEDDVYDLPKAQKAFCDLFYISFRSWVRK
nr:hypothetical protein [Tanacetum cinerariifolium]